MSLTSHSVAVVVNWHLTEACDFSCRYCYAHWERAESIKDLIREEHQVRALVTELGRFFRSDGAARKFGFYGVDPRLNVAGGGAFARSFGSADSCAPRAPNWSSDFFDYQQLVFD
jgi:radical S-adenosyl methionine domain-containing protein 2